MKKIKLVFGTVLALLLSVSLLVPASMSAAEEPVTEPVVEPAPTAAGDVLDQALFDTDHPDGIKQGQTFNLKDYFTGDIAELTLVGMEGEGSVRGYPLDDPNYGGYFFGIRPGQVSLTFNDAELNEYVLTFNVVEEPVSFILDPTEVTMNIGESKDVLVLTDPADPWWFWELLLADTGETSVDIKATLSDASVANIEMIYDENGNFTGYTVTGLKAGTATLTMTTPLGDYAVTTITVTDPTTPAEPEPTPTKPTPTTPTPSKPSPTTPTPKPSVTPEAPVNDAPATGDTTNTTMYELMMLVALVGMGGYAVLKKQK